jgi:glycerophosphoryl diester phosphodiesterase
MIHNIAHRGASAYEPENTLRAFERAIEMGATMLEVDIHLTLDDHPVVIHDADLSRTAKGAGRVRDTTLEQIKQLDAGKGEQIPTLAEVIDLVRDRAELYIELKGQQTPARVVEALHATDFVNDAVVGSFFPWLPQKVKFLDPKIRTSVLIRREDRKVNFVEWALAIDADYVHPCWERASRTPHRLLTPDLIADFRRHGLGVIVWHEERPSELRELVKLDVDGICTNTPDLLSSILQEAHTQGR